MVVHPFISASGRDTSQVSCPACAAPLRALATDAAVAGASRRLKRGRLEWNISVPTGARDATAKACARLFDVPRARLKLIAGGKTLVTEAEVMRVAEAGKTILVVGSRRGDIVATASPLDRARAAARRLAKRLRDLVFVAFPARSFLARRSRVLATATARLWWLTSAFLRSAHPGWQNPYQAAFDERRRGGSAGRDARTPPPPRRRAPDDGQPHRLG